MPEEDGAAPPKYGGAVPIDRFVWTEHALQRLDERGLTRFEVEEAIREGHEGREANEDGGDCLIVAKTHSGISIETVYDHPDRGDQNVARVVSVWRLAEEIG